MSLASANASFRRVGAGKLFLVPAPTSGISSAADYLALFYNTASDPKPVNHKTGITPWCNADKSGLSVEIKLSKVAFDPCVGSKTELVTGLDACTATITMYDVDAAHLNDLFGSQTADLLTTAASTGVASSQIALLGPASWNTNYCAMWEMPSQQYPGEFGQYIFPLVNVVGDVSISLGKDKAAELKITLQLSSSPYVLNSGGFGVVALVRDPTSVAQ